MSERKDNPRPRTDYPPEPKRSFLEQMEYNRFGFASLIVLVTMAICGISAGVGGSDFLTRTGVLICLAMAALICYLAFVSIRTIIIVCGISCIVALVFLVLP